jgi:hypothetical protein
MAGKHVHPLPIGKPSPSKCVRARVNACKKGLSPHGTCKVHSLTMSITSNCCMYSAADDMLWQQCVGTFLHIPGSSPGTDIEVRRPYVLTPFGPFAGSAQLLHHEVGMTDVA